MNDQTKTRLEIKRLNERLGTENFDDETRAKLTALWKKMAAFWRHQKAV